MSGADLLLLSDGFCFLKRLSKVSQSAMVPHWISGVMLQKSHYFLDLQGWHQHSQILQQPRLWDRIADHLHLTFLSLLDQIQAIKMEQGNFVQRRRYIHLNLMVGSFVLLIFEKLIYRNIYFENVISRNICSTKREALVVLRFFWYVQSIDIWNKYTHIIFQFTELWPC